MNQQDLENLPCPMFNVNWWERILLARALKLNNIYLCNRLRWMWFSQSLKAKIIKSLGGHVMDSLEGFLARDYRNKYNLYSFSISDRVEMRNIWIRKLLASKGE